MKITTEHIVQWMEKEATSNEPVESEENAACAGAFKRCRLFNTIYQARGGSLRSYWHGLQNGLEIARYVTELQELEKIK